MIIPDFVNEFDMIVLGIYSKMSDLVGFTVLIIPMSADSLLGQVETRQNWQCSWIAWI